MTQPHPQQDHEKVWKLTARGDAGMTIEWDTDLAYLRNQKRRYENMGMDCRIEESLCQPATHTPAASASEPGLSKLCFGTITLACEECRACNEIETCTQKQKYLDYDKQQARKAEREQVLTEVIQDIEKMIDAEQERTIEGMYSKEGITKLGILAYVSEHFKSLRGGAKDEGGERR